MDALHRTRRFEVQRIDYGIMEVRMCGFLEKSDHQSHGASPERYSVWNRSMDCTGMTDLT